VAGKAATSPGSGGSHGAAKPVVGGGAAAAAAGVWAGAGLGASAVAGVTEGCCCASPAAPTVGAALAVLEARRTGTPGGHGGAAVSVDDEVGHGVRPLPVGRTWDGAATATTAGLPAGGRCGCSGSWSRSGTGGGGWTEFGTRLAPPRLPVGAPLGGLGPGGGGCPLMQQVV
jgi:hypothetical protein